tara:strand:- start:37456 stop:38067 length:612 start_codon:yes stop_codon:yes gene_type:complete
MISIEQLHQCFPNTPAETWHQPFLQAANRWEINTPCRIAAFLSQTGHESADWKILEENLNYSGERLRVVFPKYFATDTQAQQYHRQPQKIANRVYSGRMGNGTEESGEGFKFRGRGLIQLTGKSNYSRCSQAIFNDDSLLTEPDFLTTPDGALASACWFWTANNCNPVADQEDNVRLTKIINGGTHGLEDRINRYKRYLAIIS